MRHCFSELLTPNRIRLNLMVMIFGSLALISFSHKNLKLFLSLLLTSMFENALATSPTSATFNYLNLNRISKISGVNEGTTYRQSFRDVLVLLSLREAS